MPSTITRHHWLTPLSSTTSSLCCSLPNTTCLPLRCPDLPLCRPVTPAPAITPPAFWSCLSLLSIKPHARPAAVHPASDQDPSENSSRVGHTFAQPTQPCHPLPNEHPRSQLGIWMSRSMDALEDWMGALEEGNGTLWKMGRTRWILGRLEVSRYIFPNPSFCVME
jgi:hypothetical protein